MRSGPSRGGASTERARRFRARLAVILLALPFVVGGPLFVPATVRAAGTPEYPDLKTLPPREIRFDRTDVSYNLDGLPSSIHNVLRGEMSLVGPRPLLVEFLANYTPEEARRHEMRPGVTGWAVVNGRQEASFEDRFRLDVWYVDHWSLGLDLRIIGRTIAQVLRRTDASGAQGMADIDLPARLEAGLEPAPDQAVRPDNGSSEMP